MKITNHERAAKLGEICYMCEHTGPNEDEDTQYLGKIICIKCDLIFAPSPATYIMDHYFSVGEQKLKNHCPYYSKLKLLIRLTKI